MLAKGRCAWLRAAALLSSPPLRAMAQMRQAGTGKQARQPNWKARSRGRINLPQGTFLFGRTRGHFYFALTANIMPREGRRAIGACVIAWQRLRTTRRAPCAGAYAELDCRGQFAYIPCRTR